MAKVSLRAYNREVEAMIDRNHLDEAVAHCKHILQTFPKHLETYRLLGKAYLEYKRYPEAVDIFSRVLAALPNDFVANVGMSIIRDEENKLDDAIWHMERAFETQPSNPAIQSELQRLYGRRDGVQLPRIRMTHGALAHMYVKGELYPQAISEIKSVLKEDPGRTDMQVLLARAYYRSGARNDAAEVASSVLRREFYCLDANRILVEILGTDHPENVQVYRQRVIELDPYAAQVSGSIFSSDEVPEAAVSLERLDWDGQPVGGQAEWGAKPAISMEGARSDEEPEWLRNAFSETPPLEGQPSVSPFDAVPPPAQTAAPVEDIPDFLRAAGWGQSTGAFDESKSPFTDAAPEQAAEEAAIAPGDLPDWVKAMAPQQPAETPAQEKEDELPDWINKIDASVLPSAAATDQPDWMGQVDPPAAQSAENQPDWMKQLESPQASASEGEDAPDWLKGFANESAASVPSTGELDWLSHLGEESKPAETPSSDFDFLTPPSAEAETVADKLAEDDRNLLRELGFESDLEPAAKTSDDFDFLNELTDESEQLAPSVAPSTPEPVRDQLGMSAEEQDDSFAWLESLAAKQGATEGLLTTPEERLEEEPDWVKQAKGMGKPAEQPSAAQPVGSLEELGKSEQEQDDSFAWLESLAAKQGATEGLLTQPEERLEEEPEWVRQAKSLGDQPSEVPAAQAPQEEPQEQEAPVAEPQPTASLEDLGKSEAERDDAFAWLESLAAKQGATEGLLTTPEERLEEEPEWVKQARDVRAEELSTPEPARSLDDTAAWLRSLDEEDAEPAREPERAKDDTATWMKSLEESQRDVPPQPVPSASTDDLPDWMAGIEEEKASETLFNVPAVDLTAETPQAETSPLPASDDLPAWMQGIEEDKASDTDFNIPAVQATPETNAAEPSVNTEWISAIEQEPATEPLAEEPVKSSMDELPSWLSELDQEQQQAATSMGTDADLPAWLRDETGEAIAEPPSIEPTRATDWHPVERSEPERETPASEPEPEPLVFHAETQVPVQEPEPVMAQERPEVPEVVSIIEEKIAAVQEPEKPVVPPRERKPKGTGKLTLPLDPVLGQARKELSGSNVSTALESYSRLIRKGRFLDEVIYDLRDALYRFPVDVDIWQSLGDAYMRSNRLQDALDAYTKAEELLR